MVKSWHFLEKGNSKKFSFNNSFTFSSHFYSTFLSFRKPKKKKNLKRWNRWENQSQKHLWEPSRAQVTNYQGLGEQYPCSIPIEIQNAFSPAPTPQGYPGMSFHSRLPTPVEQPGKERVTSLWAGACSCNPSPCIGEAFWLKEICLTELIWKCKLMMPLQPASTAGRFILETRWHFGVSPSKPPLCPNICIAAPNTLCLWCSPGIPDQI